MTAELTSDRTTTDTDRMLDIWAANLDIDGVSLAPFMPPRLDALAPDDPRRSRICELVARARGMVAGIIL